MSAYDPQSFRDFEVRGWERIATAYDTFFAPISEQAAGPVLDAVEVRASDAVLDVATGPGYLAAAAAARGADVIGIDIAASMIELAAARYPGIRFEIGDAEQLAFPDASFDAVVGSFVLPHLSDARQAIREWIRVLRSGGQVAQAMWAPPDQTRIAGLFLDAAARAGAVPPPDLPVAPPFFAYSTDDALSGLLGDAGLVDVRVRSISLYRVVPDAGSLWDGMLESTVRTSTIVAGQTPETQRRIRAEFDELAREYATTDGLAIPAGVKIAAARKPG